MTALPFKGQCPRCGTATTFYLDESLVQSASTESSTGTVTSAGTADAETRDGNRDDSLAEIARLRQALIECYWAMNTKVVDRIVRETLRE